MSLQTLTANLNGPLVRRERLNGRSYLVAPCVMMTECVANGTQGPLFYPEAEHKSAVPAWNNKPIVVNHPEINGKQVSADDPAILEKFQVGMLLRTKWNSKLRTECWFDEEKTKKVEPRIIKALNERKMMEVSTGLFIDKVDEEGEHKGIKYTAVARNHRPDHLAILPDKIGACSIAAGAGLLQLNHADMITELRDLIDLDVQDVQGDLLVYVHENKFFSQRFVVENSAVRLLDSPVEVTKEYVPISNSDTEKADMAKKELVDALIANEQTQYEEGDRSWLMELNEDRLQKMAPVANKDEEEEEEEEVTDNEEDTEVESKSKGKKPVANNEQEVVQNAEEYISKLPPAIRAVVNAGLEAHNAERDRLIEVIIGNARKVPFKKDVLLKKEISELRELAALAAPEETQENARPSAVANFFGVAPPPPAQRKKEEILAVPTLNEYYATEGKRK